MFYAAALMAFERPSSVGKDFNQKHNSHLLKPPFFNPYPVLTKIWGCSLISFDGSYEIFFDRALQVKRAI